MEILFMLLVLVALAVPVVLIWLWVSHNRLRRTVRQLREDMRAMQTRLDAEGSSRTDTAPARPAQPNPWSRAPDAQASPLSGASAETGGPAADVVQPDVPMPSTPPRSFVFGVGNAAKLGSWLKDNWFTAVAALSLAMAGVFLVQYGIEQGILSPRNRVLGALALGAGLIGFGIKLRRRFGGESEEQTAFLPSAFAGAGVVTLFVAVLAARRMYDLIGPETAFVAYVAWAVLTVLLGWSFGPLLTVIGVVGAVAAPFIVGGASDNVAWLFYYFAMIAAVGLSVDAMKRSAWVSTMALAAPYAGAALLWMGSGSEHFLGYASLAAMAAICIPTVTPRPAFAGVMPFGRLHRLGEVGWPEFPTRLAAAGMLALSSVAVLVSMSGTEGFWLALIALSVALAALILWLDRTDILDDLAAVVALAMLVAIAVQGLLGLEVARIAAPVEIDIGEEPPAQARPLTWLIGLAIAVSAAAAWKSIQAGRLALCWAAGAALFAPGVAIVLALWWHPLGHMSEASWALHVIAIAALMTFCAERAYRIDGPDRLITSIFALSALNMIGFAISIVLTETALTLGFAGIALSSAWLDRRFDMRALSWFAQLGALVCSFRLVLDPGVSWALQTSLVELCIGFLGTIALLAGAWLLASRRERVEAVTVTESVLWSLGGIFACLLVYRALDAGDTGTHWALSLFGTIWLVSAAAQFHRARLPGILGRVRKLLGHGFGAVGLLLLGAAMTLANPLVTDTVLGPPIFDSLMVAYLLPAALLGWIVWRFEWLAPLVRISVAALASLAATLFVGLEIRRLWQGSDLTLPRIADGELYSYTVAMLLTGTGLLLAALIHKSPFLRRAAIVVIAVTIAKVFLIDMSGLQGLIRVLSFLLLGLVLAGLALLNRWLDRAFEEEAPHSVEI